MANSTFKTLSVEQLTQCETKIGELRAIFPQADALSGSDRVSIRKLDIRAQNFARDAINWSKDVPEMAIPFIDIKVMEESLGFHEQMVRLGASLESLARYVNDLALLSGSNVETMARACYLGFKLAAQNRVNVASTAYAMLKTRYKGYGKKGQADPLETETANPLN
jgi:hypothetical protein